MSVTDLVRRVTPYWVWVDGLLFVFVPKCGSNSIYRKILAPMGGLSPLAGGQPRPGDVTNTFGLHRNPFDRAISLFEWQRRKSDGDPSFKSFLMAVRSGDLANIEVTQHAKSCSWYLEGVKNALPFEDYEASVRSQIPWDGELPHTNKSDRKPMPSYYLNGEADLVREIYKTDFERYGYDPHSF